MTKPMSNKNVMQKGILKNKILRVEDFICSRCRVQATGEADRICGICKALGKTAETVAASDFWQDVRIAIKHAKNFIFESRAF